MSRKKKTDKPEKKSEEKIQIDDNIQLTEGEKIEPENIQAEEKIQPEQDGGLSDLEKDLLKFEETTSTFKPENNIQDKTQTSDGTQIENIASPVLSPADYFKLKMFFGFFCYFVSGAHAFIFNMMSKYEISVEDMKLSQFERNSLEPYLKSPEILAWINKIPSWMIFLIHTEFMMFQKFNRVQADKKANNEPTKKIKEK